MKKSGVQSGQGRRKGKASHPVPSAKALDGRFLAWTFNRNPVWGFILKFVGYALGLFLVSLLPGWDGIASRGMDENARVAGAILNGLGEGCHVTGASIWSAGYGITVEPDCSALELIAFYSAAVLAFPASLGRKILGILAGITVILAVNLLRIASLYWVGIHFPAFFGTVHVGVWPGLLIVVTILVCVGWIQWGVTGSHEPSEI